MKITLISSLLMDWVDGHLIPISMDRHRECPPYGVYLLAEVLRAKDHEVIVVDLVAQGSLDLLQYENDIQESTLIGISATSLSWSSALDIIRSVRHICPETPLVIGGIHATMFDEYILSTFPVDYVIRGEGEIALPLLAEAIEKKKDVSVVPNLSLMQDNRVFRTPLHTPITGKQMCEYPIPDYSRVPLSVYNGVAIESSRGCPFNCSFCSTSYRRSWRSIPPEEFVTRLEAVIPHCKNTQLGYLQIVDDEFSGDWMRAKHIAELLSKKDIKVSLIFDSRANDMTHEDFITAIAPHTFRFLVGAECGYDEGLSRVGKGTTCEKLEKAASIAHKQGISDRCDFSFILGLPWETKEEVLCTVRFACRLYAMYGVRIMLQWYCLIPGSTLWDQAAAVGKVNASIYDNYGFFRSPYLFFGGVPLSATEIWDISDSIAPVLKLSKVNESSEEFIQYAVPEPVLQYFNRQSLVDGSLSALHNLRDLSQNVRRYNMT